MSYYIGAVAVVVAFVGAYIYKRRRDKRVEGCLTHPAVYDVYKYYKTEPRN